MGMLDDEVRKRGEIDDHWLKGLHELVEELVERLYHVECKHELLQT